MEGEEDQHKHFQSQIPHFFKIILHETLQNRKVGIPKSFVQRFGRSLCLNKVYLKVTSGDTWEVELHAEEDGCMWLNNGWQEFVEFYNIKFGYFLTFCYLGNSEFQVLIFDKTTLEIKYPYKRSANIENHAELAPRLLPIMPKTEESDPKMLADTNYSQKGFADLGTTKSINPIKESSVDIQCVAASNLISDNPFFELVMTKALWKRHDVPIKRRFLKHFMRRAQLVTFEVAGKWWHVKVCLYPHIRRGAFCSGWRKFARENSLQVGDTCVFELIKKEDLVFRVTIHKGCKSII